MVEVLVFIHILGALSMGFYLFLPVITSKIANGSAEAQLGTIEIIRTLNRIAQFGLIIQLLTGGYLMTKGSYSIAWMVVVFVLFLAIAAIGGIMGKPLRLALADINENKSIAAHTGKIRSLSMVLAVCLVVISFLMVFRDII